MKRAEQRQDATERASASRRPAERRARRGAEDRGQALTEFVLVLPILLLVIFGILKTNAKLGLCQRTCARLGIQIPS